jgi:hypothetical protein
MPQLHTSLHFHLTPIVMINGSSRRDLILDSQYFFCSILCNDREPVVVPAVFATRALREVRIGEHSSWGGLPTYILLVVIRSALRYPASTMGTITGTLEVHPSRSSHTRVGLAVKLPSAFALEGRFPSGPRKHLHASVTFWEAYTP